MILFDDIVQVLDLPQFTPFWNGSFRLQFVEGLWIGGVFIDGDHARSGGMRRSQRFREEAFGRFRIACRTQEELERVALGVLCWLLWISVPKMRAIDVSTRFFSLPSSHQAGGGKVSQTLFLSSF